jgi:hypothetical protein
MTDKTQKNGGPAYPTYYHPTEGFDREGMTLRDWFAGQALGGILAGYHANPNMGGVSPPMWAEDAYQYADAMLAQREKSND